MAGRWERKYPISKRAAVYGQEMHAEIAEGDQRPPTKRDGMMMMMMMMVMMVMDDDDGDLTSIPIRYDMDLL